jgi:hypothetical protein
MKLLGCLFVAACASLVGCAGASQESSGDESSASALTGSWQQTLSCNGGAAVLDVDSGERRNLQFVIRDRAAIGYLATNVRVSTRGILAPSGEIILQGWQNEGVWDPSGFHGFEGGVDNASVSVRRESGGVKVTFHQDIAWSRCDGNVSPSTGMCDGPVASGVTYNELANWFFNDCR